ncbi:beta-galactosidase trimerization domain-containing protein [Jiangella gansuensis]|uniref:beta-galactosidase trimerization domain-containing protein n=1 Tax=Jiangella gansuensis TaxID=281473 RepID=UPI00047CA5E6|nr:beta-galactosidase trimerization domain-containing protein [Jiangella gansuensis]
MSLEKTADIPKDFRQQRALIDMHLGDHLASIDFDVEHYMAEMSSSGIRSITFMTKDAFGTSYYPTQIGVRNKKLASEDMLREACDAARSRDIEVVAYYNCGLNSQVATENPDYRQRTPDGSPIENAYTFYDILCLNSPYSDYVIDQLSEIVTRYPVAGVFLDITYVWPTGCYCEYCRGDFLAAYGYRMPTETPTLGTAAAADVAAFRRATRTRFLRTIVDRLKAIRRELTVSWNHAGDLAFANVEADKDADVLCSEFHQPHYLAGSLIARWNRRQSKPYELMMPVEMGSWGEWTVAPAATLDAAAAVAIAHGAALSVGHAPVPNGPWGGRVAKPVMDAIQRVMAYQSARSPWTAGAEPAADTALVFDLHGKRMLEHSAIDGDVDATIEAAAQLLTENHVDFDVIASFSRSDLERYNTVVLPDVLVVDDEQTDALMGWVNDGGTVVATHRTGWYARGSRRAGAALDELFGIATLGHSHYSVRYIGPEVADPRLASQLPDMPILIRSGVTPSVDCAVSGAEVLASFVDPEFETTRNRHVYHQHAHPARIGMPAITRHRFGAGSAYYLAAPIESSYRATGSPWLRRLFGGLMGLADSDSLLAVTASPQVLAAANWLGKDLVVHLIAIPPATFGAIPHFPDHPIQVGRASITVARKYHSARVVPEGQSLAIRHTSGTTSCEIEEVGAHTMIHFSHNGDGLGPVSSG